MKTKEQIQYEIYDIINDCPQHNGNYAADGIDIGQAADKISDYIINMNDKLLHHLTDEELLLAMQDYNAAHTIQENSSSKLIAAPYKWNFEGIRKDNKWYTLDGVTEINFFRHHKYTPTCDVSYLTDAERLYVIKNGLN